MLFLDEIVELGLDEQAMLLKAVEEKRFYPMGSDQEVESDFQLIAGTHRDLRADVAAGRFREDLFARINLWTYHLPGLAERPEDIEPNIDHLLARHASEDGRLARFSSEARARYLAFAQSLRAPWRGNFRDLAASITRLATLAEGGRIGSALVDAEIARLEWLWHGKAEASAAHANDDADGTAANHGSGEDALDARLHALLGPERLAALDLFDRLQLRAVIALCQRSASLADAGRQLFNHSRTRRSTANDSDRLRKYLARFGLNWVAIQANPVED